MSAVHNSHIWMGIRNTCVMCGVEVLALEARYQCVPSAVPASTAAKPASQGQETDWMELNREMSSR
jgi:hypothetical protein